MILPDNYPFRYRVLEQNLFRITSPYEPGQVDFSYNPETYSFLCGDIKCQYPEYYWYIPHAIKLKFKDAITYVGVSERQTECVRSKIAKKIEWSARKVLKAIFDNEIAPQINPSILAYHKNYFKYHQRMMDLYAINSLRINNPIHFRRGTESIYPFIAHCRGEPNELQLASLKSINGNIYKYMLYVVINEPIKFPIVSKYHFVAHYYINTQNDQSQVWRLSKDKFPIYIKDAIKLGFIRKVGKRIDTSSNILNFCSVFDEKVGSIKD